MTSLRARAVFSGQQLTVSVVESLEFRTDRSKHMRYLLGSVKPIAVIVTEPDRTYALDLAAQPVDIDGLDLPDDFNLE